MTEQLYGYECHDCGAVYAPGVSTAACVDEGHYIGPIGECELPQMERYLTSQKAG